jgi:hypothetical protein
LRVEERGDARQRRRLTALRDKALLARGGQSDSIQAVTAATPASSTCSLASGGIWSRLPRMPMRATIALSSGKPGVHHPTGETSPRLASFRQVPSTSRR